MANETISFSCPACGIKLTVPASLAGISGPCPSCRAQIQAPNPVVPQSDPPPSQAQSDPSAEQQIPVHTPPGGTPPALKPEPRQLPNRAHSTEVVAKPMPAPKSPSDPRGLKAAPLPRHPHKRGLFARFAMLAVFLIATVALVYGVLTVLNLPAVKDPGRINTPPRIQSPEDLKPEPEPETPVRDDTPQIPSLPTPAPEQPTLIEPAPGLPDGVEPKSPGIVALEVLEKFLAAESLEERLPMIETKTPPGELAMSCLARPLPNAPKMLLEFQESNPLEEVVDFYFRVDFETKDHHEIPQTILVRTRGRSDPKVVVDPFLDLFGGRLAAYASGPKDDAGVFQVIASALATCTDPNVPNREKKLTLKLLARDNTKEIAEAYFGKMSKIGEMLEDGTYSLSYAKATPCTVMLRWNTEDDVNHPYLEAIAIKALDWNP